MQSKPQDRDGARRLIWLAPMAGAALLYVAERSREPGWHSLETPERRHEAPVEAARSGLERPFRPAERRAVNLVEGRLDDDGTAPSRVLPPPPLHLVFPAESDLPHLIGRLSDPSAQVRADAAAALGTFSVSAAEAIPALTAAAESDPDAEVRRRARSALYNIRGYDPGWAPEIPKSE